MSQKAKTEKPVPKPCVCGGGAVMVKARAGKMFTCPNPERCEAGPRTMWRSNEEAAILEWNRLVAGYRRSK